MLACTSKDSGTELFLQARTTAREYGDVHRPFRKKRCGKTRWVSVKNSHVLCTFSHKHLLNSRTDIRRQRKDDSEGSKRATLDPPPVRATVWREKP